MEKPTDFSALRVVAWVWRINSKRPVLFFGGILVHVVDDVLQGVLAPYVFALVVNAAQDFAAEHRPVTFGLILQVCLPLLVVSIGSWISNGDSDFTIGRTKTLGLLQIYIDTLSAWLKQSQAFYLGRKPGELVSHTGRAVQTHDDLTELLVDDLSMLIVQLVGMEVILAPLALWPAIAIGLWSLTFIPVLYWATKTKRRITKRASDAQTTFIAHFVEVVTHALRVKVAGEEDAECKTLQDLANAYLIPRTEEMLFNLKTKGLVRGMIVGAQMCSIVLSFIEVANGHIAIGTFVLIQLYLQKMTTGLWDFVPSLVKAQEAVARAGALLTTLEHKPEVADLDHPQQLVQGPGKIEFRDVSFRYCEDGPWILHHFCLEIKPGELVAIIGSNGVGKTTLFNLLLRLYDPQTGAIFVDGQDIKNLEQRKLRRAVACVLQQQTLLPRSVAENILYGNKQVDPDRSLDNIIEDAVLSERISSYDAQVGERGDMFSGGEQQRLLAAGMFAHHKPWFVLMDELTGTLDPQIKLRLWANIRRWQQKNRLSSLVITHDNFLLREVDRIILLGKNGVIQADGEYLELLARNSDFRAFWQTTIQEKPL
ncbi:MAG TPA: ABC transporter ATP-binding protein [Candidatus Acidoferrum sp.]|nr:ABC transporter ATP-binding protein [Candidatus Acidoferrum sp.]